MSDIHISYFDNEHDNRAGEPGSGSDGDADVELVVMGDQDRRSREIHLGSVGFNILVIIIHWTRTGQWFLGGRERGFCWLFKSGSPTSDFPKNAAGVNRIAQM